MKSGLTQKALGAQVGTSESAICRLERGAHAPSVDTLQRIADAFGKAVVVVLQTWIKTSGRFALLRRKVSPPSRVVRGHLHVPNHVLAGEEGSLFPVPDAFFPKRSKVGAAASGDAE